MSQRNPTSLQRSSVALNVYDMKKMNNNNGKMTSLQSSRALALTSRTSKISNSSVTSGSGRSRKSNPSSTGVNRTKNPSSSNVSRQSKKRAPVTRTYDPIRLPEDILTIQAHTVSTPVTELPYLLIAAHIAALPTARQFYPPNSATPTPLTVFRDMFVMTVDVRGYKPKSVRLSTEGQLIIIECLQTEVPQVIFTQTGTVDASDQYVMDTPPTLSSMPVHTSFSYVQHRVKLPEDFSEEGLKVGMDDVSGHVIITGRLVHDQKSSFPEPWNKNKIVKKIKGPLVNTSCSNLSKEDARKLAAFHAVQGTDSNEKAHELVHTGLLVYGKKQWLEREGAKLRAIQHRALRESIRQLTESKKGSRKRSSHKSPDQQGSTEQKNQELQKVESKSKICGGNYEEESVKCESVNVIKETEIVRGASEATNLKEASDAADDTKIEEEVQDGNVPPQMSQLQDSSADCQLMLEFPLLTSVVPTNQTQMSFHYDLNNVSNGLSSDSPGQNENTVEDLIEIEQVEAVSSINNPHVTNLQTLPSPPQTMVGQTAEDMVMLESIADNCELMEKQDKLMWEKLLAYAGVKGKTSLVPQRPAAE